MNRDAQIPMLLLPLMALVLAGIALYSFASFGGTMQSQSGFLSEMTQEINFNEQYLFAETKLIAKETIKNCPSCLPSQLKQKFIDVARWRDERYYREGLGNFFSKVHEDKFGTEEENNKITIKIDELFIQSSRDYNKIKRNFTICMIFDSAGKFLNNCLP